VGYEVEGHPKLDGDRLRKRIIEQYRAHVTDTVAQRIPLLESALIYNDCEVSLRDQTFDVGYETLPGYFVRKEGESEPEVEGDSTIASLISRIQYALGLTHNPLFVGYEKAEASDELPHKHQGFDFWFKADVSLSGEELNYWRR
jgi:hypothetical protein